MIKSNKENKRKKKDGKLSQSIHHNSAKPKNSMSITKHERT
jgi:hypothetical protein